MTSTFSTQMTRWSDATQERTLVVLRGVVIALFSAVIRDTPVDTGRLRSNWQVVMGLQPNLITTEDTDRNAPIRRVNETAQQFQKGHDIAITMSNSMPYAYRIEYEGWSSVKSPDGMLRRNVNRFKTLLVAQARRNGA
jgi:hypothetical protein